MVLQRVEAAFFSAVDAARDRSALFDHFWRAILRFSGEQGGRLAAAISYYGFFAAFSLSVVAFSVIGRVLGPNEVGFVGAVDAFIGSSLPWITDTTRGPAPQQVTALSAIFLALSGVGWVESLRTSQRAIWCLDQHPGNWLLRRLIDLALLVGLGLLLGLSIAATSALDHLIERAVPGNLVLRAAGIGLALLVNLLLAAAVLGGVARLHLSPRRLLPSALLVAVGVLVLNTVGRLLIERSASRPAYQLVAGAVGLLIYLYLLNQLILFGAALAATASRGTVVDLVKRPSGESPGATPTPRDDERRQLP